MRKGILVCLLTCLAMLATAGLSRADTYVLQIPSTQPWTNTNIWLEVGDWLEIWATGSIKWADPGLYATPDGMEGTSSNELFVVTDPSVPQNSLIGNIALSTSYADGSGFFVGSHYSGFVPIISARLDEGFLYLGHNDGAIYPDRSGYNSYGFSGDNSGSWTVEISVTKGGGGEDGDVVPEPCSAVLLGSGLMGLA